MSMSPFCIPKVLKSATKILKIGSQIKILCKKIFLNRVFSIVKLPVREITILPEKSKLIIFHQKCTKPNKIALYA